MTDWTQATVRYIPAALMAIAGLMVLGRDASLGMLWLCVAMIWIRLEVDR